MGKAKQQDNPFIEPSQQHAVVDMKGNIVLHYFCFHASNELTVYKFVEHCFFFFQT